MSYHTYGQTDWFYGGKGPADTPEYVDSSGQKLAPVKPAGPAPTAKPAVKTTPKPAVETLMPSPLLRKGKPYLQEDLTESDRNVAVYAVIGFGILAALLIAVKVMKKATSKPESSGKTITLEIS